MRGGNAGSGPVLAESHPAEARPARWSDLRTRVASAVVLVPLALVCLWWGGWAWALLVGAMMAGVFWEYTRITRATLAPSGAALAGGAWLAAAGAGLIWLRLDPVAGAANLVFILLVVWSSDIGAYLAGRLFGGPKLAPAISPGKTWSGALGGLAAAFVAGNLVALLLTPAGQSGLGPRAAGLAILFGMVAQAGDLAESWLKRQAGVKDSSRLIPGHGGLLDRLDALLAVAPVATVWALFLGRGVVLWC